MYPEKAAKHCTMCGCDATRLSNASRTLSRTSSGVELTRILTATGLPRQSPAYTRPPEPLPIQESWVSSPWSGSKLLSWVKVAAAAATAAAAVALELRTSWDMLERINRMCSILTNVLKTEFEMWVSNFMDRLGGAEIGLKALEARARAGAGSQSFWMLVWGAVDMELGR
ncbi:hypothetical protein Vafri_20943 [Volvox africanus]|uniref:Uncharacterized protein n=1 Tax=Volvox africanus TaxID=51714 RepID=A0A8J4BXX8_9CHLO|nr:hypothetical protein Vafri_20943 [Volvox africanus]